MRVFLAVKVGVGAFPASWFFGIDLGIPELLNLFGADPPFTGLLDATGASLFAVPARVPSGLPITDVTTHWTSGCSTFIGNRTAVLFCTP